jgi:uncharacterized caspase-like protein
MRAALGVPPAPAPAPAPALAAAPSAGSRMPDDVAVLLAQLRLSAHGAALCGGLGVASLADLSLLQETHLERHVPAMKLAERLRLLDAVAHPERASSGSAAASASAAVPLAAAVTALVVGVSAYNSEPFRPLANAAHDARGIADALRALPGAAVTLLIDPSREELQRALEAFGTRPPPPAGASSTRGVRVTAAASPSSPPAPHRLGLLFFAGHGLQWGGLNYLIPADFRLPADAAKLSDIERGAVSLDEAMRKMRWGEFHVSLIALDCCRSPPQLGTATRGGGGAARGLAHVTAPARGESEEEEDDEHADGGTLVAFATAPGEEAEDASSRVPQHSPFTAALMEQLRQPGRQLRDLMPEVTSAVQADTRRKQTPWASSSLTAAAARLTLSA